MFTTKITRTGRIMIENDGRNADGVPEQGNLICRVTIPAMSNIDAAIHALRFNRAPNAGANYIDGIREDIPGVRVLNWKRV